MNYEWSLDRIYTSFDCDEFLADWARIDTVCDEMSEIVNGVKSGLTPEGAAAILAKYEEIYTLIDKSMLYIDIYNDANENKKYTDCKITRISQTKYQASTNSATKITFPGGLQVGNKITENEAIWHRPNI